MPSLMETKYQLIIYSVLISTLKHVQGLQRWHSSQREDLSLDPQHLHM